MEPKTDKELLRSYNLYTSSGHYIGPVTMTIQETRIRIPWYKKLKWWLLKLLSQVTDIDDPFVSVTKHGVLVFSFDMKEIMKERDNGAETD